MKHIKYLSILIIISVSLFASSEDEVIQSEEFYDKPLSELLNTEIELKANVGSRSGERDLLLSEVPIDVITSEQLRQNGSSELSQILERYVAGFNFPRPSINDGTDHSRPFTLRGLNPDQVLVLINGKRVHQSSLLNVNGSIGRGSSSVDLNTIPIASIDRVEILRDGAAAQYGSDAIAGVINIILKGYGYKDQVTATYGKTKAGDGEMKRTDIFYSIPLQYDGFFNVTAEYRDRGATNRAGPDRRRLYPVGDPRNDLADPITMHYGDADTQDILLLLNNEINLKNGLTFYLNGSYDDRKSEAGAFFRSSIDSRNNTNIYPDGFLPIIAPKIKDYSLTFGAKDIFENGIKWDLSYSYGFNDYHFYVKNTLNHSLGDSSPASFDSGGTSYAQQIANLDLSKNIDQFYVATGVEFRNENYKIYAGEEDSYILGSHSSKAGAQGFPGFQPSNEVDENRNNIALYLDTKYKSEEDLTLGLAGRYEYYDDFGSNVDGKLSIAYKPISKILLRSTVSTGFRAPSLAQSYYTATSISGISLSQTGTFGVEHPISKALGATKLKPEKSQHFSAGFVFQPVRDFSFSVDYFYTTIKDRILLTDNITENISNEVKSILNQYNVAKARYFSNSIDTKTQGVDLRLRHKYTFEKYGSLKTEIAYQYASTEVTHVNVAPSILGNNGEQLLLGSSTTLIEDSQPKDSLKIYTQYTYHDIVSKLNVNRYGSYKTNLFGTVYDFDAKWTTDVEVEYTFKKSYSFAIGGENIFDIYPDKWKKDTGNPILNRNGVMQYSQHSPYGYNGAFYYARFGVSF